MKTFKSFLLEHNIPEQLIEAVHSEIQDILDNQPHSPSKLNTVSKKIRDLAKRGVDTGIQEGKPKKGSSRAVLFPSEHKPVAVDGRQTAVPTAVKIAFPGTLDKHRTSGEALLGEHQNEVESDDYNNEHSVLKEESPGTYTTQHHGVLAPVYSSHKDNHWLEMHKITPMKKGDFKRLTVTETHPKGVSFDDMYHALNREYSDAHGQTYSGKTLDDDHHEHIMSHPWVDNYHSWMLNTGNHPGDISPRNMGIFHHPVTGKEYPVVSDYGFSNSVSKRYAELRKRSRDKQQNVYYR